MKTDRQLEKIAPEPGHRLAYSTQEVATMLNISTKSVYRLLARGLLRANKSLRHKLIGAEELARFVREN
jgi:excisionase family DNA binding protein